MNTNELIGPALDWAVERAKGTHWSPNGYFCYEGRQAPDGGYPYTTKTHPHSTDWSQGGPIIEREDISFQLECKGMYFGYKWNGVVHKQLSDGPTPLIAAMRCYVASKLGDKVEIPEELK